MSSPSLSKPLSRRDKGWVRTDVYLESDPEWWDEEGPYKRESELVYPRVPSVLSGPR